MTGLPSICDDFGTMELQERVATYRPGWFVTWNEVEDDKMEALAPFYHLQRVAAFPTMDDPERNLLILYRLDRPTLRPAQNARAAPSRRPPVVADAARPAAQPTAQPHASRTLISRRSGSRPVA